MSSREKNGRREVDGFPKDLQQDSFPALSDRRVFARLHRRLLALSLG